MANGINNAGDAVGVADLDGVIQHAVLFRQGRIVDLGILPGGGNFSSATGINELGQIVGIGATADGIQHAVRWTPRNGFVLPGRPVAMR